MPVPKTGVLPITPSPKGLEILADSLRIDVKVFNNCAFTREDGELSWRNHMNSKYIGSLHGFINQKTP
jgi:hypothetical protein